MNQYVSETGQILNHEVVGKRITHTRLDRSEMIDDRKAAAERILINDLNGRGIDRDSYDIRHEAYALDGTKFFATFGIAN